MNEIMKYKAESTLWGGQARAHKHREDQELGMEGPHRKITSSFSLKGSITMQGI